jgi:hypothetical protein
LKIIEEHDCTAETAEALACDVDDDQACYSINEEEQSNVLWG